MRASVKEKNAIQEARDKIATSAFLLAHKNSSYLKYPMTSSASGMGRKG